MIDETKPLIPGYPPEPSEPLIGGATLTSREHTLAPDRPRTYALRPKRGHLRDRGSARVQVVARIHQPGAKKTRIVRAFTARR